MKINSNYKNLHDYYIQKYPVFMTIAEQLLNVTPIKNFAYQRFYIGGEYLVFFYE